MKGFGPGLSFFPFYLPGTPHGGPAQTTAAGQGGGSGWGGRAGPQGKVGHLDPNENLLYFGLSVSSVCFVGCLRRGRIPMADLSGGRGPSPEKLGGARVGPVRVVAWKDFIGTRGGPKHLLKLGDQGEKPFRAQVRGGGASGGGGRRATGVRAIPKGGGARRDPRRAVGGSGGLRPGAQKQGGGWYRDLPLGARGNRGPWGKGVYPGGGGPRGPAGGAGLPFEPRLGRRNPFKNLP